MSSTATTGSRSARCRSTANGPMWVIKNGLKPGSVSSLLASRISGLA
jgi:hypothetical protein